MRLAFALACAMLAPAAEETGRWQMRYFHDEDKTSLTLNDIEFASPRRGVAVGFERDRDDDDVRPMSLVTSDGGETWTRVPLKEVGVALFFLNESLGWMATDRGIWVTEEAGRSWRKLKGLKGVRDLYFADAQRGWAVGTPKAVWETVDGGKNWKAVPAAKEPTAREEYSSYEMIGFADGQRGAILGGFTAPSRRLAPTWADPAEVRRERPSLAIMLDTVDGGKTWKGSTAPLLGRIVSARYGPGGLRLLALRFVDAFDWPSEVYLGLKGGKLDRVYREKNRAITDSLIPSADRAFLAGYEVPGRLSSAPIPGKVRIVESRDFRNWREMPVDYRAVANRVILTGNEGNGYWAATNTGMILKLVQ